MERQSLSRQVPKVSSGQALSLQLLVRHGTEMPLFDALLPLAPRDRAIRLRNLALMGFLVERWRTFEEPAAGKTSPGSQRLLMQVAIRGATEPELYGALNGLNQKERTARLRRMALAGLRGPMTEGFSVSMPAPAAVPAGGVSRGLRSALAGLDFD